MYKSTHMMVLGPIGRVLRARAPIMCDILYILQKVYSRNAYQDIPYFFQGTLDILTFFFISRWQTKILFFHLKCNKSTQKASFLKMEEDPGAFFQGASF